MFVYKGNSNNKFCKSVFIGDREVALSNGYTEIDEKEYRKLCNHELRWNDDGALVPYIKTAEEIAEEENQILKQQRDSQIATLKWELTKVLEDVEQEQLGIVRNDYVEKRKRAAEIINELRVLEGKEPREIRVG